MFSCDAGSALQSYRVKFKDGKLPLSHCFLTGFLFLFFFSVWHNSIIVNDANYFRILSIVLNCLLAHSEHFLNLISISQSEAHK